MEKEKINKVENKNKLKNSEKTTKNSQKNQKNAKKIEKNQFSSNFSDNLMAENSNKNISNDFENDKFFDVFMKQNNFYVEVNRPMNDIMYANLIMLFAIFVSALLPIVSLGLPLLLFIYFEAGIYGFVYKVEAEKQYKFEELFVSIKKAVKIFCVFVIRMFLTLFFSCLLIVPGVIVMLQYAFCPIIIFESDKIDVRGVLALSREMT